jgi:hypothetical protein
MAPRALGIGTATSVRTRANDFLASTIECVRSPGGGAVGVSAKDNGDEVEAMCSVTRRSDMIDVLAGRDAAARGFSWRPGATASM